uniref:RNA-directed DNA polymerase n=1 Tax=Caenorhabditis japonica TaxID=281687 RepID=A0A8R1HY74_CAEJA
MPSNSNELFKEHELLDDEVSLLQEGQDPRDVEAEYSVEAGQEGVADVNGGGRVNDHTLQYDSSASQVRERNNSKKVRAIVSHIRKYSKASETHIILLLEPITKLIQEQVKEISERENYIEMVVKEAEGVKNENEELKRSIELLNERNGEMDEVLQIANVASLVGKNEEGNGGKSELFTMLADFGISTPAELLAHFQKVSELEYKIELNNDTLQEERVEENAAREALFQSRQELTTAALKIEMLTEQLRASKAQLKKVEDQINSNRLRRAGESSTNFSEKQKATFQTMVEPSARMTPSFRRNVFPGELHSFQNKINLVENESEIREKPRRYCEETEEILEEYGSENGSALASARKLSNAREKEDEASSNFFTQFLLAQAIPEPPVFSASPGKLSISTFEKTFRMKFGTLPHEFQLTLLETKYLEGKALKVFKGVPAGEKRTVAEALKAMASRLRVSVEDESRTAKAKWEVLRRREGQSMEDFCLQIDELSRVAFSRTPSEELSSLKTAKLISALNDHTIRCMIEAQLMDLDEVKHYDVCRKLATRFEFDAEIRSEKRVSTQSKIMSRTTQFERSATQQGSSNFKPVQRENGGPKRCWECQEIGCHAPTCSRAPRSTSVTCYKCGEIGHYSNKCSQEQLSSSAQAVNRPSSGSIQEVNRPGAKTPIVEHLSEGLGPKTVEKGRIGGVEVEMVIDSGATISLIPKTLWHKMVKVNGKEWERKCALEEPDITSVFTASNQPMKLVHQVKLETSLKARTRDVVFYVVDVERESVILGTNAFEAMGISMSIQGVGRDIKLTRDKGQRIATGEVEGFEVVPEDVENLDRVEESEKWVVSPGFETRDVQVNSVDGETDAGMQKFSDLCAQLRRGKEEENARIWELVKEFQDVFALDDKELGRTNVVECEIELLEAAQPIRQKPRPIPLALRPEIRKMLVKMINQGVIRESKSPWSSPVVLVKKKDGSVRMCIDYRKVNKVVKNNAHPLPHIEATLQSLAGKRVFTTLDLLAGYWQIPLKENSKLITAFAIGSELFEWNVLPFGLVTSPAVFQAMMESVIGELLGKSAFVYVDDLLIASATVEEHERDLKEVLSRLRRSGLKLRATKCHIAQEKVEYLGHQVTPEGVQTEEKKVERMKSFAKPTNAKELLSFLGLVGYYRKFIINFAKLAAPLTPLTSKKVCWKWENEQEDAFQKLIQAVCQAPVLAQPNVDVALEGKRPFMIYTDASRQGVGAVLAQEGEDGMQHPIAFASKSLTPAETRYHVTDLEALAMMFALRRFKTIVYGTRVVVCTDHKPLISLLKGSPLADRLLRWSLEILEFNVKIVYVAGKANVVADALSRGGALGVDSTEGETTELTNVINE